jgi:hypothetical protein
MELEIFPAISEGNTTLAMIAKRCHASERGVRILCDFRLLSRKAIEQSHEGDLIREAESVIRTPALADLLQVLFA